MTTVPCRAPYVATRPPMSRRHFLRGAGVVLGLPFLDAMLPTFGRAQPASTAKPDAPPRRMLAVLNNLGFLPENFFPTGAGSNYVASPYLELLQSHRRDFTVFTGVSLPDVDGGHPTDIAWLTGAPHPGRGNFRNTISLDQVVANHIGQLTRFGSMTLSVNTRSRSLSFDEGGRRIDPLDSAADVYRQLFLAGPANESAAVIRQLETGRSILDAIGDQARGLQRDLTAADRERVDQYYTSVRELEDKLHRAQTWAETPKPAANRPPPVDPRSPGMYFEKIRLMYDLATLALRTDSSRAITLFIDSVSTPIVEGRFEVPITETYMRLAYHQYDPSRFAQRQALDLEHFRQLNGLLDGLAGVQEPGGTLLDRTQVLWGSNFGDVNFNTPRPPLPMLNISGADPQSVVPVTNAPSGPISKPKLPVTTARGGVMTNKNLPIVFAGGGWKHGQHLVFDTEKNYPLTNLHLSMLHRMGIPEEKFSSSTGEFAGLEMA